MTQSNIIKLNFHKNVSSIQHINWLSLEMFDCMTSRKFRQCKSFFISWESIEELDLNSKQMHPTLQRHSERTKNTPYVIYEHTFTWNRALFISWESIKELDLNSKLKPPFNWHKLAQKARTVRRKRSNYQKTRCTSCSYPDFGLHMFQGKVTLKSP